MLKNKKIEAKLESNFDHICCLQYQLLFFGKISINNQYSCISNVYQWYAVCDNKIELTVLLRKKYASLFASRAMILEYKKVCTYLQGISYWNVKSDLGLTNRNMQDRFGSKVVLEFWDREIFVIRQFLWNANWAPSASIGTDWEDFLNFCLIFVQFFFWFWAYIIQ